MSLSDHVIVLPKAQSQETAEEKELRSLAEKLKALKADANFEDQSDDNDRSMMKKLVKMKHLAGYLQELTSGRKSDVAQLLTALDEQDDGSQFLEALDTSKKEIPEYRPVSAIKVPVVDNLTLATSLYKQMSDIKAATFDADCEFSEFRKRLGVAMKDLLQAIQSRSTENSSLRRAACFCATNSDGTLSGKHCDCEGKIAKLQEQVKELLDKNYMLENRAARRLSLFEQKGSDQGSINLLEDVEEKEETIVFLQEQVRTLRDAQTKKDEEIQRISAQLKVLSHIEQVKEQKAQRSHSQIEELYQLKERPS